MTLSAYTQCVETPQDPCLSVNQSIINKAAQVADELKAARDVIAKFSVERSAHDAERVAATALIKGLNDLMATKDKMISEYDRINALYRQVIDFQQKIIENLEKQLSKPKSGWQKLLGALKRIGDIAIGIAVGRVLN